MSNPEKINKAIAKNFKWGTGCEGWHLLTSDALTIAEETMPPQSQGIVHYHEVAQHFIYVLEGEACLEIDGITHLLNPGDGISVYPGSLHQIRNESGDVLHFLAICSPNSFEDFKNEDGNTPPNWKPDFFSSRKDN